MFAVALFCIACAVYWLWIRMNVKTTEPPYLSGAWPLLGNIPLIFGDSYTLWNKITDVGKECDDLGGVVAASFGPRTVYGGPIVISSGSDDGILEKSKELFKYYRHTYSDLGVSDPDDCLTVANTCMEKDPFYGMAKAWLGHGLVTARYAIWKDHRKLLNPAFSQILLDTFMGVFNSQSRKLVKDLEEEVRKGPFDHLPYIRNNALETICLTALGVDYTDSNLNSKYVEAVELLLKTFVERFVKPWWHTAYTFQFSKLKKKQDACLEILHNMSNTVLQNSKSKLNGNRCAERSIIPGSKFKPFMDLILELSIEKGAFTDQEIREHVDTILVAGHDTSANELTFIMTLLGSHPEAQEKVFAEIQEILGVDRDVEKMDLSKLVYLEAVLKESMRLFPIAPLIARRLDQDVKLKNYTLSAGRTCILFIYEVHRGPNWGPDANEFKPERWLEPGRLPSNPNAFAAFSFGKRHCIGKAYAMMSMKTTLVHMVRRYKIKADHTKMRLKVDVLLKPVDGHFISIERRT